MEVVDHLVKYAYLYAIGAIVLGILVMVLTTHRYDMHLFRNMFRSKKEGFQTVSGGEVIPDTMNRETCEKLKETIASYEQVKIQHKNTPIENLDEVLGTMKEYFVSYDCQ